MPQVKLNQRFSDSASVSLGEKKTEWFDLSTKGFYLETRESGGKTWRLRLRDMAGRNRVFNLGDALYVTYQQAVTKARELKAAAEIGQWGLVEKIQPKKQEILFAEFIENHYLPYASVRKRSIETDLSVLKNHLLPDFGSKKLNEITRPDLIAFHTRKRGEGYAPGTVDRMMVLMRYALNLAKKWEFVSKDFVPMEDFPFFNAPNARERYLSQAEVHQLIVALRRSENSDLLQIITGLLLTGLRKSELLCARWEWVNFQNSTLTIPVTKQGRPHRLPLTPELQAFFQGLPSKEKSLYLFPSKKTGLPYKSIFQSWNTARNAAGMPELRIHDLRHSFASFLVNSGRSLYEVQRLLGHTSSKTTQRYAHLSDTALLDAMASAAKIVGAES
jgi:integrase